MNTTTPDDGAVTAQPSTPTEAVTTEELDGSEQVITTDEHGAPTLEPVSPQAPSASEAVSEEVEANAETPPETQAEAEPASDKTDDEIAAWSEKKGLKINPDNPNEVKLARMQLEAERKMHEANQYKSAIQPPEPVEETGDPNYDVIAARQNQIELKTYVRDWFDANPEMKDHRGELQRIATERPWLSNMDDVKAHFLADPNRMASLKKEGGRQALQNIAQKQQQVPPSSGATNSNSYQSAAITPQNVYDLVDRNGQSWFESNYDAIQKAMSGEN